MAENSTEEKTEEPAKKESPMGFLIALAVISIVAAGAGWFLGGQLGNPDTGTKTAKITPEEKSQKTEKSSKTPEDIYQASDGPLLVLEPIIVTLRKSNNTFLRLELAVLGNEDADFGEDTRLQIGSDVAAFAQTLTLQQISGPSGYLHFREDILDRANLSTEGQVKNVYILSMVAE